MQLTLFIFNVFSIFMLLFWQEKQKWKLLSLQNTKTVHRGQFSLIAHRLLFCVLVNLTMPVKNLTRSKKKRKAYYLEPSKMFK